ncbi:MAG TPA: hypothetical protein VGI54_08330 [Solirubrobacteraceae bacterium]
MADEAFNPFVYSVPVTPDDLIDRREEATLLRTLAEGGHNTRLSAPRRYGKTSLLGMVLRDAEAAGLNVALVDLYGVVGVADVVLRLREAYRTFRGPIARRADRLVVDATLRAGLGPGQVELELTTWRAAEQALVELLDLPKAAHERTGARCLVAFDEFQDLAHAGDGLDGILRSRIQHHGAVASYAFAGSHEGMLSMLFDRRERPLFGQARKVALEPLADADVAAYVGARFEDTGREVGRALEYLLRAGQGHPQRTMILAHHLWSATAPGATAGESEWFAAQAAVFDELREPFAAAWDGLAEDSDRRALTAVASGHKLFSATALERYGLSRGSAARARDRLLAAGDLSERDGTVQCTDPLWAAWVAAGRRRPPVPELESDPSGPGTGP